MRDTHLESLSDPIASLYGFSLRNASFLRSKEFRVSWKVVGKETEIGISDYMYGAPDNAISDLVRSVFDKICRREPRYGEDYIEWVTSDQFIRGNQKTYLERSKNLRRTYSGEHYDLTESLDRLLDSELLKAEDIHNSSFTWTSRPNLRRIGYCSPMMRVVAVSSALDRASVPEYVLDYVVYHESLHLRQGYRPFERKHDREFKMMESEFPEFHKAEKYLEDLANHG